MKRWPSTRARQVLAALVSIGWTVKRQSGSHRTLARPGWPNYVFAFHDRPHADPGAAGVLRGPSTAENDVDSAQDERQLPVPDSADALCQSAPIQRDHLRSVGDRVLRQAGDRWRQHRIAPAHPPRPDCWSAGRTPPSRSGSGSASSPESPRQAVSGRGPNLPAPAIRPTTPHPERPLPFRPLKRPPRCGCHEFLRRRRSETVDYAVHRLRDLVGRVSGEIFGNGVGVQPAARPAQPSCVSFRSMEQLIRKRYGRFHTFSITRPSILNNPELVQQQRALEPGSVSGHVEALKRHTMPCMTGNRPGHASAVRDPESRAAYRSTGRRSGTVRRALSLQAHAPESAGG